MMLNKISTKIKFSRINKKWKKRNTHNRVSIGNYNDLNLLEEAVENNKIKVGNYSYGQINVSFFGNPAEELRIGSFCSIAADVHFLCGGEHELTSISTFPFSNVMFGDNKTKTKGPIIINDDVWIGHGATILSGVFIGQGAVIAAGAVVAKDVPPYAIVGGVPAKVIKYRFEPEIISKLQELDYSKLSKGDIEKHIDELYAEIKDKKQLDWLQKNINE